MTERQKQMIENYLPNDPDPELESGEYYCRSANSDRIYRVRVTNIFPYLRDDIMIYGLVHSSTGKHFQGSYGTDPFDGVPFGYLYDNKEDCRNYTHDLIDYWEDLRELQRNEKPT